MLRKSNIDLESLKEEGVKPKVKHASANGEMVVQIRIKDQGEVTPRKSLSKHRIRDAHKGAQTSAHTWVEDCPEDKDGNPKPFREEDGSVKLQREVKGAKVIGHIPAHRLAKETAKKQKVRSRKR